MPLAECVTTDEAPVTEETTPEGTVVEGTKSEMVVQLAAPDSYDERSIQVLLTSSGTSVGKIGEVTVETIPGTELETMGGCEVVGPLMMVVVDAMVVTLTCSVALEGAAGGPG